MGKPAADSKEKEDCKVVIRAVVDKKDCHEQYFYSIVRGNRLPPCSKRDSNPHSHFWPKDFKSFVSTIPPFERFASAKITVIFQIAQTLGKFVLIKRANY